MNNTTIKFEQASLIVDEASKIKIYKTRFFEISRLFQKSPFMQIAAWDTWKQIIELVEPVSTNDWSKFLFKKLDDLFLEVENYQNDSRFQNLQNNILEMIKKCNELNIDLK